MIEIYTDGAYSSKRDKGGIGIVVLKDGHFVQDFSCSYEHTTNNKMELIAVITALKGIKKPIDKVIIYSDSMYVIGCATKGWKRKKNINLWKLYDSIYSEAAKLVTDNIQFQHVKGHANCKWNNICDELAVEASQ